MNDQSIDGNQVFGVNEEKEIPVHLADFDSMAFHWSMSYLMFEKVVRKQ